MNQSILKNDAAKPHASTIKFVTNTNKYGSSDLDAFQQKGFVLFVCLFNLFLSFRASLGNEGGEIM